MPTMKNSTDLVQNGNFSFKLDPIKNTSIAVQTDPTNNPAAAVRVDLTIDGVNWITAVYLIDPQSATGTLTNSLVGPDKSGTMPLNASGFVMGRVFRTDAAGGVCKVAVGTNQS